MVFWRAILIVFCIGLLSSIGLAQANILPLQTLPISAKPLDALAFSPNGYLFAVGGRDNSVHIYDAATHALHQTLNGHQAWVTRLAFNHAGTQLASGGRDGTVILWDVPTGQALIQLIIAPDIEARGLVYAPDDSSLYVASQDGVIYRLALATMQPEIITSAPAPIWDMTLTPNGENLAWASEDNMVYLYALATRTLSARFTGHTTPATRLAFAPDGTHLAAGGLDGSLRLWDLTTLQVQQTDYPALKTLSGHLAPIMGIAFTSDSTALVTTSLDGTTRLWDMRDKNTRELALFRESGAPLVALALTPDNAALFTTGTNGQISIWDIQPTTLASWRAALPQPTAIVQAVRTPQPSAPNVPAPNNPPTTGAYLSIPSAGIGTGVTTFPLGAQTWEIDPWEKRAGHFAHTSWLNRTGNIVIGGHSEYPNGAAGIFRNLYNVGIGDEIFLSENDVQRRYVVVNVLQVDYRDVSVVYDTPHNRLTLITCDIPSYVAEQGIYYARLVVIADAVP